MTALEVITEARSSLGDVASSGWTDTRLLSIVGSGQRDICKQAKLLKRQHILQLVNGRRIYELPADSMQVTRLEHQDAVITVSTRDKIDTKERYNGSFTALTDKLGMGLIELYPTPEEVPNIQEIVVGPDANLSNLVLTTVFGVSSTIQTPYIFNVVTGVTSGGISITESILPAVYGGLFLYTASASVGVSQAEGIVVGNTTVAIDPAESDVYGVVTGSNLHDIDSVYGVVTSALTQEQYVTIYYNSTPERLNSVDDRLLIPDLWYDAMVYYTIGVALADDNDAGNERRSDKFLGYYNREVSTASDLSSGAFNSVQSQRTTSYRGIANG